MRAEAHLRIGRLLAAHTPPERLEEGIFEIVNQLNRAAALITSAEEQEQVAELNLIAGQRAKQSTAYDSALTYLAAGRALLPEDCWERCGTLPFALELHQAECEFLTGALAEADERLAGLARRDVGLPDLAVVARLQVELFTTLGWTYRVYNRDPAEIIVVNHDTALAIKVSFPRLQSSGSKHDSDVYGGQQYAPLLGLEVPG